MTVVSGFCSEAMLAAGRGLLLASPNAVLLRHDLSRLSTGTVRRVVQTCDAVLEDETVELVHGCVSCTLREDVLPALIRLAQADSGRRIVLLLPEIVEPDAVASACAHCLVDGDLVTRWLHLDSYLTVVHADTFVAHLQSDADLVHLGMQAAADDDRSVAAVVARQVEFADTVLLWGGDDLDAFDLARTQTLLHRLAPWARHHNAGLSLDWTVLLDTPAHQPERPGTIARGLEGYGLGVHEPLHDSGVASIVFRARRPMHPQRLHDALEHLAGETLRSRGHVWLATQPGIAIGWESAGGGIALGNLGKWLAALPEDRWDEASTLRRLAAEVEWDPYYGDRGNHLLLIGLGLDPADIHRHLSDCLLTDAELALGDDGWKTLPDPFAGCFTYFDHSEENR